MPRGMGGVRGSDSALGTCFASIDCEVGRTVGLSPLSESFIFKIFLVEFTRGVVVDGKATFSSAYFLKKKKTFIV